MAQNWILNKETGQYELFEDYETEKNRTKQKALFDYNIKKIEEQKE